MRGEIVRAVRAAALRLLLAEVEDGRVTTGELARAAGIGERGVRRGLERGRVGVQSLSRMVARAGVSRMAVWEAAGVVPYLPCWCVGVPGCCWSGSVGERCWPVLLRQTPRLPADPWLWPVHWGAGGEG